MNIYTKRAKLTQPQQPKLTKSKGRVSTFCCSFYSTFNYLRKIKSVSEAFPLQYRYFLIFLAFSDVFSRYFFGIFWFFPVFSDLFPVFSDVFPGIFPVFLVFSRYFFVFFWYFPGIFPVFSGIFPVFFRYFLVFSRYLSGIF